MVHRALTLFVVFKNLWEDETSQGQVHLAPGPRGGVGLGSLTRALYRRRRLPLPASPSPPGSLLSSVSREHSLKPTVADHFFRAAGQQAHGARKPWDQAVRRANVPASVAM